MDDLSKFEADLWEAADNLRANSKLTSSDYFMPVLGIIFLRHAANRFDAATRQIEDDQAAGKMPKRKVLPADYIRRRALFLPEAGRYDSIMAQATTDPAGLPKLVTDTMTAIETEFDPLRNVLPKDYGIFEPKVIEELLAKFSIQKAHDNGEFFTPSSLVQLIVNVIEPDLCGLLAKGARLPSQLRRTTLDARRCALAELARPAILQKRSGNGLNHRSLHHRHPARRLAAPHRTKCRWKFGVAPVHAPRHEIQASHRSCASSFQTLSCH